MLRAVFINTPRSILPPIFTIICLKDSSLNTF